MNILLLSDYFPPPEGGIERHVFLLARALKNRGHNVTVFASGNNGVKERTNEEEIKTVRYNGFFQRLPFLFKESKLRHHPPARDPLITRKLEETISEVNPHIMHTHGWILYSVLGLRKKHEIPIVHTLHDYNLMCPKKDLTNIYGICNSPFTVNCVPCSLDTYGRCIGAIKSILAYLGVKKSQNCIKYVHRFIAVSSFVKKVHLKHLPLTTSDIVVAPNFFEGEIVRQGKSRLLPKDFILFVGTLSPHKGVDVLINAYNQLNTETKLVVIGKPEPGYNYKTTDKILVFAEMSRQFVEQALAECKFLVAPSICPESFGLVALEAMFYKKAVIATNIGGLPEVIKHGETGLLVPPRDSKSLAEAMSFLMESPITEDLGKNGYQRAITLFSKDKVLPIIESVYKKAISHGF